LETWLENERDQGWRSRKFGDQGWRSREFGDPGWREREFPSITGISGSAAVGGAPIESGT